MQHCHKRQKQIYIYNLRFMITWIRFISGVRHQLKSGGWRNVFNESSPVVCLIEKVNVANVLYERLPSAPTKPSLRHTLCNHKHVKLFGFLKNCGSYSFSFIFFMASQAIIKTYNVLIICKMVWWLFLELLRMCLHNKSEIQFK